MLYRMVTFSMTLTPDPVFKVTAFLKSKYLKNGESYGHDKVTIEHPYYETIPSISNGTTVTDP